MNFRGFVREQVLRQRLTQAGCLVVYDPEGRYRAACLELAADGVRVVDASESSIESREAAIQALRALGQPQAHVGGVPVYVPAKRPER